MHTTGERDPSKDETALTKVIVANVAQRERQQDDVKDDGEPEVEPPEELAAVHVNRQRRREEEHPPQRLKGSVRPYIRRAE
jgi:hypothetical protein